LHLEAYYYVSATLAGLTKDATSIASVLWPSGRIVNKAFRLQEVISRGVQTEKS